MAEEPVGEYCREVEVYLCRKNDGHLIRVVGPSFDVVSGWAGRGVPIKIVFEGIDRYFERYYRSGPRRRPVKIDFCEADVLDVFDEWRRAMGFTNAASRADAESPGESDSQTPNPESRHRSLRAHLERVVTRLSSARASGAIGPELDALIDRLAGELDVVRAKSAGLRGAAREAAIERLAGMDAEMLEIVGRSLDRAAVDALDAEASEELRPFRAAMAPAAYDRAHAAAIQRLIRVRFNLPTVLFT